MMFLGARINCMDRPLSRTIHKLFTEAAGTSADGVADELFAVQSF